MLVFYYITVTLEVTHQCCIMQTWTPVKELMEPGPHHDITGSPDNRRPERRNNGEDSILEYGGNSDHTSKQPRVFTEVFSVHIILTVYPSRPHYLCFKMINLCMIHSCRTIWLWRRSYKYKSRCGQWRDCAEEESGSERNALVRNYYINKILIRIVFEAWL